MMLEFGSENKEITERSPNAPFILSISDNSDNELIIVIALPKRGEKGEDLDIIAMQKISSICHMS